MLALLIIAGAVGYKHYQHIEVMTHNPCDLCVKCPTNIISEKNWSIPYEFLNQNGTTKIYSTLG